MVIGEIYYQENYQVGDFLYRHYGARIFLQHGDTSDDAYDLGEKITRERFMKDMPNIKWNDGIPVTEVKKETTIYPIDMEVQQQFEDLKKQLETFAFKEDAEEYLLTTEFKYNIDAKNIINKKPSKK